MLGSEYNHAIALKQAYLHCKGVETLNTWERNGIARDRGIRRLSQTMQLPTECPQSCAQGRAIARWKVKKIRQGK